MSEHAGFSQPQDVAEAMKAIVLAVRCSWCTLLLAAMLRWATTQPTGGEVHRVQAGEPQMCLAGYTNVYYIMLYIF